MQLLDIQGFSMTSVTASFTSSPGPYIQCIVSRERIRDRTAQCQRWRTHSAAGRDGRTGRQLYHSSIWGRGVGPTAQRRSHGGNVTDRSKTLRARALSRRHFATSFLAALQIFIQGVKIPRRDGGFWAGAMGAMSVFAVELPASGRWIFPATEQQRDIETDVPDVLAAIAHICVGHGWTTGCRGESKSWSARIRLSTQQRVQFLNVGCPRRTTRAAAAPSRTGTDASLFVRAEPMGQSYWYRQNLSRSSATVILTTTHWRLAPTWRSPLGLGPIRARAQPHDVQLRATSASA